MASSVLAAWITCRSVERGAINARNSSALRVAMQTPTELLSASSQTSCLSRKISAYTASFASSLSTRSAAPRRCSGVSHSPFTTTFWSGRMRQDTGFF
jgi:hypothetical protein